LSQPAGAARHRSRQGALQTLYAVDLRGAGCLAEGDVEAALLAVGQHFELPAGALAFARELVLGVARNQVQIDTCLREASTRWRLERMATVDRNTLRLGAYEILFGEQPAAVTIDEAVELAREFGSDASPSFVNGVLDALRRERERRA
jgi:N utilization substance protein B